jgi:predicted nucleic acid-binding protein
VNYLLDTCAVSEFTKPQPDAGLVDWLRATPEAKLFLSAVTLGEIQQGISRLAVSARRQRLQSWLDDDLQPRFAGRVLPADDVVCLLWGDLRTRAAQAGHPLPVLDALIGATALAHRLLLVTRNEADFAAVPGLQVVNPWTP